MCCTVLFQRFVVGPTCLSSAVGLQAAHRLTDTLLTYHERCIFVIHHPPAHLPAVRLAGEAALYISRTHKAMPFDFPAFYQRRGCVHRRLKPESL